MEHFRIIGLMSGTSLDGVDVVDITLTNDSSLEWSFIIHHAKTYPYSKNIIQKLQNATRLSAIDLQLLDHELGLYFGAIVNEFVRDFSLDKDKITAVASHGHTIFHQPEKGVTLQIGNGVEGSLISGLKWVCDFRSKDVALEGNGAPLVPVGDAYLFSALSDSFLNLGGFSNISFRNNGQWTAFDICPVNLIFNHFSKAFGLVYDKNGELGRKGVLDIPLYDKLNSISYYHKVGAKSLGKEWLEEEFFPIIYNKKNIENVITTCYHHVAFQLLEILNNNNLSSVFITGGGAKNKFLIELLTKKYSGKIIIPSEELVDFKEAVVFGLLGALRLKNEVNVFSSVTGARKDSCSGVIHFP